MGLIETVRAPLFVSADRPDRVSRAVGSGTDAVILDLEDALAPAARAGARAALADACAAVPASLPVIVRINASGTADHAADLAALRAVVPAAVMVPKAEDPARIDAVRRELDPGIALIALIETARGLARAEQIAACPGVIRLAFGSVDFCADLSCEHRRDILLPARSGLVLVSRLAGIAAPLDGVTLAPHDTRAAQDDAAHARALGMGGKLCIHPAQIAPVRAAFVPSAAERDWALRVLAAGAGVVLLDGQMVDEPVRLRARRILAAGAAAVEGTEGSARKET